MASIGCEMSQRLLRHFACRLLKILPLLFGPDKGHLREMPPRADACFLPSETLSWPEASQDRPAWGSLDLGCPP